MTVAVDITDGCVLITKSIVNSCQGNVVFAIHEMVKAFNQLYITNEMECFSFNSCMACHTGCKTYKSRLAYSVTVTILAQKNCILLKD